jgi:hypothetical protein
MELVTRALLSVADYVFRSSAVAERVEELSGESGSQEVAHPRIVIASPDPRFRGR